MLALSSLLTGQAGTDTSQELAHRSYLSQYYLGTLKVWIAIERNRSENEELTSYILSSAVEVNGNRSGITA